VVRSRRRLLVVGTVLAALVMVAGFVSPAASATVGNDNIKVIWKLEGGTVAQTVGKGTAVTADIDDPSCANDFTCVVCAVYAFVPWQGPGAIISFRGEVHCYYPDQPGQPAAVVNNITIQVGLWDYLTDRFLGSLASPGLTPPYAQPFVSELGLTGAIPTIPASNCGSGAMQTYVSVSVWFAQCCPWDASGEFGSYPTNINC
jgi:hypothetical protein